MNTISRADLKKRLDAGEDIQLLDVRGKECCYDRGHLPGALSIPLNELEERAPKELDKDKPVIVYCGSFTCDLSPRAAAMLKNKLGFQDVIDYEGGIADWRDSGLPIEQN